MKCQAIIEDFDRPAYYASMQRICIPGTKECSFKARFRVGELCLCKRHAQLALDGLLQENGVIAGASMRRDVRRYPEKFPHGIFKWARDLEMEKL